MRKLIWAHSSMVNKAKCPLGIIIIYMNIPVYYELVFPWVGREAGPFPFCFINIWPERRFDSSSKDIFVAYASYATFIPHKMCIIDSASQPKNIYQ